MNAKAGIQYGAESNDMFPEHDRSGISIRKSQRSGKACLDSRSSPSQGQACGNDE
ncbi:MAG: hypothetical protein FWH15_00115 [Betaproteobacteria bacterium]|nr:hypothetical protein [Betaproteobacteria bacterium]